MIIICDNYIDGIFKTANFKFLNLNYIICYSHSRVTFSPLHPKSRKISDSDSGRFPKVTAYLITCFCPNATFGKRVPLPYLLNNFLGMASGCQPLNKSFTESEISTFHLQIIYSSESSVNFDHNISSALLGLQR